MKTFSTAILILALTVVALTFCRAVISGTKGRIEIDGLYYAPNTYRVIMLDGPTREIDGRVENGFQYEAAEVARGIAANVTQSPVQSREDTVAVMRTMDEIRAQIGVTFPGE